MSLRDIGPILSKTGEYQSLSNSSQFVIFFLPFIGFVTGLFIFHNIFINLSLYTPNIVVHNYWLTRTRQLLNSKAKLVCFNFLIEEDRTLLLVFNYFYMHVLVLSKAG